MNTKVMQFGFCYVVPQGRSEIHPIAFLKHELVFYPERGRSLYDMVNYRPFASSVITENPYVIACYDREKVKVWDEKKGWVSPEVQTYGASETIILHNLLGVRQSIPSVVFDGGKAIEEEVEKLDKTYKKALQHDMELVVNNNTPTYLS